MSGSHESEVMQSAIDGVLRWCDTNGMLVSAHKCAVLTHGPHEANYHINGTVIPVEDTVRDLGIHMSGNLDFSVHIHTITQSARRLINTLFRCFAIKNPEVYIRMYNAIVIPKILYGSPCWRPYLAKHERLLTSVQNYFRRRLSYRCNSDIHNTGPDIIQLLNDSDDRVLDCIVKDGSLDHYLDVRPSNLRQEITVWPKFLARYDCMNNCYAWRMHRRIRKEGLPRCLKRHTPFIVK